MTIDFPPTVCSRPINDDELQQIRQRADAASPGPWRSFWEGRDHLGGSSCIVTGPPGKTRDDLEIIGATTEDQDFIAHARADVPRLVAEVERLRALLVSSR